MDRRNYAGILIRSQAITDSHDRDAITARQKPAPHAPPAPTPGAPLPARRHIASAPRRRGDDSTYAAQTNRCRRRTRRSSGASAMVERDCGPGGLRVRRPRNGGEGGIRTPGRGLGPYDGLANRCFRPLSHLSAAAGTHLNRSIFLILERRSGGTVLRWAPGRRRWPRSLGQGIVLGRGCGVCGGIV